jgi:hypothetical protein
MDPDPDSGGPKTYGSYGSESATLPSKYFYITVAVQGTVPVSTELIFLDVELHVTKAFHVQKCGRGLYVDRGKSEESKMFIEIFSD